jgi:hypothetical protein
MTLHSSTDLTAFQVTALHFIHSCSSILTAPVSFLGAGILSGIALGYGLHDRGVRVASIPALGPSHLPIQWVPEGSYSGGKAVGA